MKDNIVQMEVLTHAPSGNLVLLRLEFATDGKCRIFAPQEKGAVGQEEALSVLEKLQVSLSSANIPHDFYQTEIPVGVKKIDTITIGTKK